MPKIYSTLVSGSGVPTFEIGQDYKWHMGISWAGTDGFEVDSASIAYVNNRPHLLFSKTNDEVCYIKVDGHVVINGQVVSDSLYRSDEPVGAYMYPIEHIAEYEEQIASDLALSVISQ